MGGEVFQAPKGTGKSFDGTYLGCIGVLIDIVVPQYAFVRTYETVLKLSTGLLYINYTLVF